MAYSFRNDSGDLVYLAPCLVKLFDELNTLFPKRDHASDGWIGDPSHAARVSDHNPDWPSGVVRAIDVDIDDNDAGRDLRLLLLKETIGDPRVWYVISNGKIYSRTHGWAARAYTGTNGHFHHVHISIQGANGISATSAKAIEGDTRSWFGPAQPAKTTLPVVRLDYVQEAAREDRDGGAVHPIQVRRVQRALLARGCNPGVIDGSYGPKTSSAVNRFETQIKVPHPNGVLGKVSLPNLGRGRFRVVL